MRSSWAELMVDSNEFVEPGLWPEVTRTFDGSSLELVEVRRGAGCRLIDVSIHAMHAAA